MCLLRKIIEKMAPAPHAGDIPPHQLQPNDGEDECGPTFSNHIPAHEYERIQRGIMLKGLRIGANEVPMYPRFANPAERLRTFENWPAGMGVTPEQLCEAGFFYSSQGDRTFCYQCGGMLEGWNASDNPWNEHAKWYPECKLLSSLTINNFPEDSPVQQLYRARASAQEGMKEALCTAQDLMSSIDLNKVDTEDMKSALKTLKIILCEVDNNVKIKRSVAKNYGNDLDDQRASSMSSLEGSESSASSLSSLEGSESSSGSSTSLSCVICLTGARDALLLPCHHIATCCICASKLTNCCVCRKPVTMHTRVFIS